MALSLLPQDASKPIQAETSYAECFATSTLLPGLPNDVALLCLARVGPTQTKSLRQVSTTWRRLFALPSVAALGAHRRSLSGAANPVVVAFRVERQKGSDRFHGINRTALFVLECEKQAKTMQDLGTDSAGDEISWVARDLPSEVHRLVDWCVVTNRQHVFVIGGKDAETLCSSAKVWRYDVYSNSWDRMTDMPRTSERMKTSHVDGQNMIVVIGWDASGSSEARPDSVQIYDLDTNLWTEMEVNHDHFFQSGGVSGWRTLYGGCDFAWASDVKNRSLVFQASDPNSRQNLGVLPSHALGSQKSMTSICNHGGDVFALWTHGLDMWATLTVFRDGGWVELCQVIPTWTRQNLYQYLQLVSAGERLFVVGTRFSVFEINWGGSSDFSVSPVVENLDLPASSFMQCVGLVA
eukprot:TRINITY_DN7172_c0_g1_i1.p1 TRINITY_DN7172_c0_g1~~TRINITY_DN7172_c0_g1_i1.p1  ORF type:complete len:409 (-),score=37.48 TRINITY_DN7172_c0_g1_i1:730-1956(-)